MTDVDMIRQEVERRIELLRNSCKHSEANELIPIVSFIDSLHSEFGVGDRIRLRGSSAKGDIIRSVYDTGNGRFYEFVNSNDAPVDLDWELVEQEHIPQRKPRCPSESGSREKLEEEIKKVIPFAVYGIRSLYRTEYPTYDDLCGLARHFAQWGWSHPWFEESKADKEVVKRVSRECSEIIVSQVRAMLRGESTPFTAKWLQENIDMERIDRHGNVQIMISDVISDERGDAGCIDIIYNGMQFWCISKGLDSEEWLCTCSDEFRNDCWIPSVKSIADFLRLWRVATGFELPMKYEK